MKVQEKNEIIAKFMGVESYVDPHFGKMWKLRHSYGQIRAQLSYHQRWDELIPVIKKIKTCLENVYANGEEEDFMRFGGKRLRIEEELLNLNITKTFEAVVRFIKDFTKSKFYDNR